MPLSSRPKADPQVKHPSGLLPESYNGDVVYYFTNFRRTSSLIPGLSRRIDTFDGAKPRFLNRGKKRRSVSTLSIPRALVLSAVEGSDRGVEWVDSPRRKAVKKSTAVMIIHEDFSPFYTSHNHMLQQPWHV